MNNYNEEDMKKRVIEISLKIKEEFNLPLKEIIWIRKENLYGSCSPDGTVKIKMKYSDGELIPELELWRTLAHELAHLNHRNHSEEFFVFNKVLVNRISELLGKKIKPEIAIFYDRKNGKAEAIY